MAKRNSRNQVIDPHKSDPRDRCYTPAYALDPLLPYLPQGTIWEPAAGEGHLVRALNAQGRTVHASEIVRGENFFEFKSPPAGAVAQVTNPPFSSKYHWIEHSYALGLPWALLLPLETLGAWSAQKWFRQYGVEVLLLNKRVNYYMPIKGIEGTANFPSVWLCWKLLPAPIVYGNIIPRKEEQAMLFNLEAA